MPKTCAGRAGRNRRYLGALLSAGALVTVIAVPAQAANAPLTSNNLVASPVATETLAAGTLFFDQVSGVQFSGVQLNGFDQTDNASNLVDITDATGSGNGWDVSLTATPFTNGTSQLSDQTTSDIGTGPAICDNNSSCTLPSTAGSYPIPIPAGQPLPPSNIIYSAATGSGMGSMSFHPEYRLALPANIQAGVYNATWDYTLASDPPSTSGTWAGSNPQTQIIPLYEDASSPTLATDWADACASNSIVIADGNASGAPTSTDGEWQLEQQTLAPAMASCYPHGTVKGQTVGYIDTDNGQAPASQVELQMQQWITFDPGIAGFFLDNANPSAATGNQNYYAEITAQARALGHPEIIWNWGADQGTSSWPFQLSTDSQPSYLVVFEGDLTALSQWVPASWEQGSGTSGSCSNSLAAIVYSTPANSLSSACSDLDGLWDIQNNTFGYYVTELGLPNPYAGLDSYNTAETSEC
jgi:methionine-rich copper-binding protein CopC